MVMHVLGVQLDSVWENKRANHDKVRRLLESARPEPSALVVLPEMFATGFSPTVAVTSDPVHGETRTFLAETARVYGIHLLAGLVRTETDGRSRNEAILIDPRGGEVGGYAKMHLFSFANEHQHAVPGTAVQVWPCGGFRLAPVVCYDLRFPELFRACLQQDAQVFAVIANWPTPRVEHWLTLLRARAIENQAYVIGVNRCGRDPNNEYPGRSQIIDPRGEVLA
ncbi:carbon-nitrogen family hydrolase, partial [bacterium]|nr:carbon-nitrogen family hydrolase [bacterium]